MHGNNAWVLQLAGDAGFVQEAIESIGFSGLPRDDPLDGNLPLENSVEGRFNNATAAAAQFSQRLVTLCRPVTSWLGVDRDLRVYRVRIPATCSSSDKSVLGFVVCGLRTRRGRQPNRGGFFQLRVLTVLRHGHPRAAGIGEPGDSQSIGRREKNAGSQRELGGKSTGKVVSAEWLLWRTKWRRKRLPFAFDARHVS